MSWLLEFLQYFCKNTSIHGMQFVGNLQISRLERIMWFIMVCVALAFNYYCFKSNFDHYLANPTVVAIKKDFRNWENPFPAVTACFVNKVDENKAAKFIEREWQVTQKDERYGYYLDFINVVSNLTYKTLYTLQKFKNNPVFNKVDWLTLIRDVHPSLRGALVTFHTKVKYDWQFVMTELGLCFSLNSKFADLLSPNLTDIKEIKLNAKDNLKCHYLNGVCYARYDSDPKMPLEYHIHSHLEVIHATSEQPLLVKQSEEYEINFKLTETYSLDDIRYLAPRQRNCRFDDEPLTDNVPVYSTSICHIECRYRLAMEKCDCKPFFYTFLEGKQCDITGLLCLSNMSHLFNQSTQIFGCNCPQPCNLMVYLKQIPKVTEWEAGYFDQRITFRWGLTPPTTKYHRKVIFGIQELIVSLGGVMSLFLGMSFVGCTESVYLVGEYFYFLYSLYQEKRMNNVQQNSK